MADEESGVTPEDESSNTETDGNAPGVTQADVDRLMATIKKERKAAREATKALKRFDGLDPDEARDALENAARAAEASAEAKGDWEELRKNLETRQEKERAAWEAERAELKGDLDKLLISDGLNAAIRDTGFLPEHHDAVEALMLMRGPKVVKENGEPRAVFVDEVGDAIPLGDFVKAWAETDKGAPYMPGTGQSGTQSTASKTTRAGTKTVSSTDMSGMGRSLEDIADGKVEVVVEH